MATIDDIAKDYGSGVTGGVAPCFIGLDAQVLQEHLDRAVALFSSTYFGTSFDHAMALYAAHTLAVAFPAVAQGGSGTSASAAATSKKAGDLAITFASSGSVATGDPLDSTRWGREFKGLRRQRRQTPRYVSGI